MLDDINWKLNSITDSAPLLHVSISFVIILSKHFKWIIQFLLVSCSNRKQTKTELIFNKRLFKHGLGFLSDFDFRKKEEVKPRNDG